MDSCSTELIESLIEKINEQTKKIEELEKYNLLFQEKFESIEQYIMKKNENKTTLRTDIKINNGKTKKKKEKMENCAKSQTNIKKEKKEKNQHKINKEKSSKNEEDLLQMNKIKYPKRRINYGFLGEAYVYDQLKEMNCFSKVKWNAETNDEYNPSVTLKNGHKYFYMPDGEHFDVYAEDSSGNKYYFEVKSTKKENRSYRISRAQKEYGRKIKENEYYIIALVSTIEDTPIIKYCLLLNNKHYLINMKSDDLKDNLIDSIKELKEKYYEPLPPLEYKIDKKVLINRNQNFKNLCWLFSEE